MLKVLRQRNFALLWIGQVISLIGDWVLIIALPFSGLMILLILMPSVRRKEETNVPASATPWAKIWQDWFDIAGGLFLLAVLFAMLTLQGATIPPTSPEIQPTPN
jgi:hypothetical protein